MSRTFQSVRVKYWEHARKAGLTPDEILVEQYLMTNRDCGPSGIFIAANTTIGYYIGYSENKVKGILKMLEDRKRIYVEEGGWIFVRGKWEHESSSSRKIQKCVLDEVETAPLSLQKQFFDIYEDAFHDTLSDRVSNMVSHNVNAKTPIGIGIGKKKEEDKQKHCEKKLYLDNVYLKDSEVVKLKEKYGKYFNTAVQIYDAWKENSKKKNSIKSDYKGMLASWVVEDVQKTAKLNQTDVNAKGWKCDDCNIIGKGKFPGRCPNCDCGSYVEGPLPLNWQERNKKTLSKNTYANNPKAQAIKEVFTDK